MTTGKEEARLPRKEVTPTPQPIIYGYMPEPGGDEINIVELLSKLGKQWKLLLGVTLGGTLLAVVLALSLPRVFKPSITVSTPLTGSVAPLAAINSLLERPDNNLYTASQKEESLPSSPQSVFNNYFNLLRSKVVFSEYVQKKGFLPRLFPDTNQPKDQLLGKLNDGFSLTIEEPTPGKKGAYIENPIRVRAALEVENEAVGVELLNGYPDFVNEKLIGKLQNDTQEIINNRLKELNKTIARLREQNKQDKLLTIQKKEQENAEQIAQLQEAIAALLTKAKANRQTSIAEAEEALMMAKSLNIVYPTTLDALALSKQKGQVASTAVTVGEKQDSSLYLQGTKYLSTLIETLKNRQSDEKFIPEINDLREKIRLIETDPVLASLKNRQSDDPWINGLPEKIAELEMFKTMNPDFKKVEAYSLDESAVVTDKVVKPKKKVIVGIGFLLSIIIALSTALFFSAHKQEK